VDTTRTDRELTDLLAQVGIPIQALSEYYHESHFDRHQLVVNYAGLKEEIVEKALLQLESLL
jgi:DNA-binding transcriptional MocR family regulator